MILHPRIVPAATRADHINKVTIAAQKAARKAQDLHPEKSIVVTQISMGTGRFGHEDFLDKQLAKAGFSHRKTKAIEIALDPKFANHDEHFATLKALAQYRRGRDVEAYSNSEEFAKAFTPTESSKVHNIFIFTEVDPPQVLIKGARLKKDTISPYYSAAHHALKAILEHENATTITATLIDGKVDVGEVAGSPKTTMPLPDPTGPHAPQPSSVLSLGHPGVSAQSSSPTANIALLGILFDKLSRKFA